MKKKSTLITYCIQTLEKITKLKSFALLWNIETWVFKNFLETINMLLKVPLVHKQAYAQTACFIRFLLIQISHQFSFKHFLMLMSDNFAWQRCQAIGTEHLHEHVPIYGLQRVTDGYFSTPGFSRGILLVYSLHATAKSYILTELDLQDLDVCMYSWTVNDAVYRCIFAMEFAPFIDIICCTILITFLIYVLHNSFE